MSELSYYRNLHSLLEQATPCVQVTLVDMVGSAPQNVGAKMLVTAQGLYAGTVGGGKIEARCLKTAQELLNSPSKTPYVFQEWNLQTDIGMTCGGVVRLFFEVFHAHQWHVAVFGAGHVAQALVPLLSQLKCRLWCFDTRADWIQKLPPAPNLTAVVSSELKAEVAHLPPDTFVLSMTMGHAHDVPILAEVFKRQASDPDAFPFVGVIGSHAKAGAIKKDLLDMGFSKAAIAPLFCPLGLPLGDNSPPEIAISMAGQLLQERDRILGHNTKWQKSIHQFHRQQKSPK